MKKIFDWIEEGLAAACLVVMTVLTFANVIARHVFSASFSFSEEITTYLFVLLSLLGTAVAAKRRAHLGLTIVTDAVSPKVRKIMEIISYLLATLFSAAIFYYGVKMVMNQRMLGQVTAGMQWPEWLYGMWIPICGAVLIIRYLQLTAKELKAMKEEN